MRPTIASVSSFVLLPALFIVRGQQQLSPTSPGCVDDCVGMHLVSSQAHRFESLCDTPTLQSLIQCFNLHCPADEYEPLVKQAVHACMDHISLTSTPSLLGDEDPSMNSGELSRRDDTAADAANLTSRNSPFVLNLNVNLAAGPDVQQPSVYTVAAFDKPSPAQASPTGVIIMTFAQTTVTLPSIPISYELSTTSALVTTADGLSIKPATTPNPTSLRTLASSSDHFTDPFSLTLEQQNAKYSNPSGFGSGSGNGNGGGNGPAATTTVFVVASGPDHGSGSPDGGAGAGNGNPNGAGAGNGNPNIQTFTITVSPVGGGNGGPQTATVAVPATPGTGTGNGNGQGGGANTPPSGYPFNSLGSASADGNGSGSGNGNGIGARGASSSPKTVTVVVGGPGGNGNGNGAGSGPAATTTLYVAAPGAGAGDGSPNGGNGGPDGGSGSPNGGGGNGAGGNGLTVTVTSCLTPAANPSAAGGSGAGSGSGNPNGAGNGGSNGAGPVTTVTVTLAGTGAGSGIGNGNGQGDGNGAGPVGTVTVTVPASGSGSGDGNGQGGGNGAGNPTAPGGGNGNGNGAGSPAMTGPFVETVIVLGTPSPVAVGAGAGNGAGAGSGSGAGSGGNGGGAPAAATVTVTVPGSGGGPGSGSGSGDGAGLPRYSGLVLDADKKWYLPETTLTTSLTFAQSDGGVTTRVYTFTLPESSGLFLPPAGALEGLTNTLPWTPTTFTSTDFRGHTTSVGIITLLAPQPDPTTTAGISAQPDTTQPLITPYGSVEDTSVVATAPDVGNIKAADLPGVTVVETTVTVFQSEALPTNDILAGPSVGDAVSKEDTQVTSRAVKHHTSVGVLSVWVAALCLHGLMLFTFF